MIFFVFYIQRLRLKFNFLTFNLNHLKELHVLNIAWDLNPLLSTAFHFIYKYHVIVIVGSKSSRIFRVFYHIELFKSLPFIYNKMSRLWHVINQFSFPQLML